jgi:YidC/Oxa1 family membrane protein insertase
MLENFIEYVRFALYAALILIGFMLYQAWQLDHPQQQPVPMPAQTATAPIGHFAPETSATHWPAAGQQSETPDTATVPIRTATPNAQLVTIKTDVLNVGIDLHGGDIVRVDLLHYPESLGSKRPFLLFNDDPKYLYIAESGLISKSGPDTALSQAFYTAPQKNYSLAQGQNEITVDLTWQNSHGVKVTKSFTFTRNSYEIKVGYRLDNEGLQAWEGSFYTQLLRTNTPPPTHSGLINLATYFGAAVSSPDKPFTKISFKDMDKANLDQTIQDGWAAMIQHYFIGAWVPVKTAVSNYYTKVTSNGLYIVGMVGKPMLAPPGASISSQATFYAGPAIADNLDKAAPNLQLTIDYGWFWFISVIIFWMLQTIYHVVGNWGWSIVLVTILIKLLFYQLSAKSFRSMAAMKKLQPKIEMLKERFGEDKQKMTQATLELYKKEKVNPMSGCLPILIQIPVFIALYWVLVESVQLRQAPFILWIKDLSQHDPYYILPVLMGISMFIQQRLNPPPPDPLQAKVMMLMPVVFTVLFANFPAGLMLYWFVNNTLSFLQQWFVMHRLENATSVQKK